MLTIKRNLALVFAGVLLSATGLSADFDIGVEEERGWVDEFIEPFDHNDQMEVRKHSTFVNYEKGQARLSDSDELELQNMMQEADFDGNIERVYIAVFADEAYIGDKDVLNKEAQALVKNRTVELKAFFDAYYPKTDVVYFNMAKHPWMISNWLQTDDALLKGALRGEDVELPNAEMEMLVELAEAQGAAIVIQVGEDKVKELPNKDVSRLF